MDRAALMDEGWDLIQGYHRKRGRYYAHPFLRDLLWDASVDALLDAVEKYDGQAIFRICLSGFLRKSWRDALRSWAAYGGRRNWKEIGEDECDQLTAQPGTEVEDRDFFAWAQAKLPPEQWEIVRQHLEGKTQPEIAASMGQSRDQIYRSLAKSFESIRIKVA